jgi:hypothetical protein
VVISKWLQIYYVIVSNKLHAISLKVHDTSFCFNILGEFCPKFMGHAFNLTRLHATWKKEFCTMFGSHTF